MSYIDLENKKIEIYGSNEKFLKTYDGHIYTTAGFIPPIVEKEIN